jgi:enoyl-CoA hydratase/carnithine racemase
MTRTEHSAVLIEKRLDHIAVITINRPHARNAINADVAQALDLAWKEVETDPNIRVAVLTGMGSKAFCAGADLKAVAQGKLDELSTKDGGFAGFVRAKRTKPWIAAIEGFALAGGFELALACDLIVASNEGAFGLPEVSVGLIAAAGGLYRLPRVLPPRIATELILTARRISAERAAELGMVNGLAPAGSVLAEALKLAQAIAANAPMAVRESLAIAGGAQYLNDEQSQQMSEEAQARIRLTQDFREGPQAFVEKRAPVWKGC